MTRFKLFFLTLFFLFLALPWIPSSVDDEPVFGFPPWALYAFLFAVLYAVVLSFLMGKFWDVAAGDKAKKEEK
ncbi:MAG: hypothetical protein HQK84_04875 [Nitrospinae bacterium]|nr:hypothetical protein [Nitrospinota bacterium]